MEKAAASIIGTGIHLMGHSRALKFHDT